MPYLIRITVAVALVAALMVWLLGALPLPLALLLAVIVGWGVFDLLQPTPLGEQLRKRRGPLGQTGRQFPTNS
jgi:hypothetical protein